MERTLRSIFFLTLVATLLGGRSTAHAQSMRDLKPFPTTRGGLPMPSTTPPALSQQYLHSPQPEAVRPVSPVTPFLASPSGGDGAGLQVYGPNNAFARGVVFPTPSGPGYSFHVQPSQGPPTYGSFAPTPHGPDASFGTGTMTRGGVQLHGEAGISPAGPSFFGGAVVPLGRK